MSIEQDAREIENIVAEMFAAISWSPDRAPDWSAFASHVRDDALLVPSARPPKMTDIKAFTAMMQGQRENGGLVDFEEEALGTKVQIFGNIAVALGGYRSVVNKGKPGQGANAFLLVKTDGRWEIVAMAWDSEREGLVLPAELMG